MKQTVLERCLEIDSDVAQ